MSAATPSHRPLNRLLSVFARESGITLGGRILGSALQLATHALLTRWLTVPEYGIFALAWTLAMFAALFAQAGLDKGVIKYGTEALQRKDGSVYAVIVQSVVLQLLIAVAFGVALAMSAQWLADSVFRKWELFEPLWLLAWMIPVMSGLHVVVAITRISQKMTYSVICERLVQPSVHIVLTVALVYFLDMSLTGALLAYGLSYAAGMLLGIAFSVKLFPRPTDMTGLFNLRLAFGMMRYSLPTSMAAVFAKTNSWADRLMIGFFLLAGSVGVYQAASRISALFMVIASMFHGIFAVLAADLISKKDRQNLNGIYRANTKWGLYVALPLFIVILFHADAIMGLVFGAPYARGGGPLVILAIGQLVNIGTGSVGLVLMMGGQQNRWMMISMIMFAVNLIGNAILIPMWGLWGASIATSGSVSIMFILGVLMARRHVGVWPYDRRFAKGLLAALVACAVPLGFFLIPHSSWWLEALVSAPLIILVYGVTLTMQGLDEDDRWVLSRVRRRILGVRNQTV